MPLLLLSFQNDDDQRLNVWHFELFVAPGCEVCVLSMSVQRKPLLRCCDQCLRFLVRDILDSQDPPARIDVLRLIMTLFLWTTPQDTGFISGSGDFGYLVAQPTDPSRYVPTTIKKVSYDVTCVRGQATSVFWLKCHSSPGGVIGAPASQPSVADIKRHIGPDSQYSGKIHFCF